MLTLWTSVPDSKVLSNLSPVLRNHQDLPITISHDFQVPAQTRIIMALGKEALERLQADKVVAKNRTTGSLRTQFAYFQEKPVLFSYSPNIGEVDYPKYIDLLTDLGLAVRYWVTGSLKPKMGEYRYVPDFLQLIAKIEARRHLGPVDVTFDTETVGTDEYVLPSQNHPGAYIVTLQATCELGKADVVRFNSREEEEARLHDPVFRAQIDYLMRSPWIKMKGANLKYDMRWLWARGKFKCTNFVFDTTLVGSLLNENRSNALNVHTKIYYPELGGYDDEFNRTVDKSRMDKVPADTLLPYAGGDVDACLGVAQAQRKQLLDDPQLTGFYVNILHPAARAFEDIENTGWLVDRQAVKELESDLRAAHMQNVKLAGSIIGGRLVAKHYDGTKIGGLNLTKPSLLKDFMFSPMGLNLKPRMFCAKDKKDGTKVPSTAWEHLEMFTDNPEAAPFLKLIDEDGGVMKTHDTYVVGFLRCLCADGRYHPNFFLFVGDKSEDEGGAVTGRLSAKNPAVQTIPKHTKWAKRIRRCFIAPDGHVIVERDYSAGELRVVACIANETNMLDAFRNGLDIHAKTAAKFAGYTYESLMALVTLDEHKFSETRQLGKAGNFGLVFGMKEDGFVVYARNNYGVDLTWNEANKFRDGFFTDYPQLANYHDTYKRFARKHKYVRTPLGRIRHLPLIDSPNREYASKAERQAINSPVQGTLTDMLIWSIALEQQQGITEQAPSFGTCHDAAYNYVPEDKVDVLVPRMLEIQENLPFEKVGWNPQIKFLADASVGKNMGEMKKYKAPKPQGAAA